MLMLYYFNQHLQCLFEGWVTYDVQMTASSSCKAEWVILNIMKQGNSLTGKYEFSIIK